MDTIFINQQAINLDKSQLVQAGGEGLIFRVGQTAVKLYHRPGLAHAAKLNQLLGRRWPAGMMAPCALAHDKQGQLVGFQMGLLPAGTYPLRQLANPTFCQRLGLDVRQIIPLFQTIQATLGQLHQQNVIVGDLNDQNLFFHPDRPAESYWVDVDSYQVGNLPCPVAMQAFLDPSLYGVSDFAARPVFTPLTDWYAYWVLLVKSLLQVHPYGGNHHHYQSLQARAKAGISLLHPTVQYPKKGRPLESLSDELLDLIQGVFEKGERRPFPAGILNDYAASLIQCGQCGLVYPAGRPGCPACRRPTPILQPAVSQGQLTIRELARVDGLLLHLAIEPSGRIILIARSGQTYRLIRAGLGGKWDEQPLFTGRSGYRFAYFGGCLVVNPAGSRQLLLLDVNENPPRQVTMLETATFGEQAVFAATPHHLFRIANSQILRGRIRNGHFLEDVVAMAHRDQSQLWAAGQNGLLAGCHRIFSDYRFFVLNLQGQVLDIAMPPVPAGATIQEVSATFSQEHLAFLLRLNQGGKLLNRYVVVAAGRGQVSHFHDHPADLPPHDTLHGKALFETTLLHPSDEGLLKERMNQTILLKDPAGYVGSGEMLFSHPAGLLIQTPSRLYLATG